MIHIMSYYVTPTLQNPIEGLIPTCLQLYLAWNDLMQILLIFIEYRSTLILRIDIWLLGNKTQERLSLS